MQGFFFLNLHSAKEQDKMQFISKKFLVDTFAFDSIFWNKNQTTMKCLILLFFSFWNTLVFSQFQFTFKDSVEVIKNGFKLNHAWAGGFNNAQFSDIDYDFDGDMDLFVFDRSKNQVRIFEHKVENAKHFYKFDPFAAQLFPNDIRYRATTLDYNLDGKNDLFTYGIGGIKVYQNVGNTIDGLKWKIASELLYSINWGKKMNLYVSSSDIPAIVDVENDGDLDVLTFHIGGEYLQYHQNQSQELFGHSDSLIFELKNECWGGFREDINSNMVILNDTTSICNSGNIPNAKNNFYELTKGHSGSTVLAFDYDGSGVMDLLIGDVAYSSLNLLLNSGKAPNTNSKIKSQDVSFPSNSTPVNVQLFPASFLLDVDFDERKDLIITPNARNVSENERSCWKYKNIGTNQNHNFIFETSAFLQGDMIEHGSGSIPVLADLTGDGLMDLIVGNFYSYKPTSLKESKIAFYRNIGTSKKPIFEFVDDDFMNFSQANFGLRMVPTFGDLDGDNKPDLILGLENGEMVYFKNYGTNGNPNYKIAEMNELKDADGKLIQVGQFASPQLFDLNSDNKLDLIVGEKTGKLSYFENVGTSEFPIFKLITNQLGGIDVANSSSEGYAVPNFFRNNDTTFLIVGAADGQIYFYDSIDFNLGGLFNLVSENFLSLKSNIGGFASGFITDLDSDDKLDLLVGQDLGGIFYLEHDEHGNLSQSEIQHDFEITIYPNPTDGVFFVETNQLQFDVNIFSAHGKKVFTQTNCNNLMKFNISELSNGIYFLKVNDSSKVFRIVKTND